MSELKLSERLRVAIAISDGVTLRLDRDQAVSFLRTIERMEAVDDMVRKYQSLSAEVFASQKRRDALQSKIAFDLFTFCWALIAITYVLAFW